MLMGFGVGSGETVTGSDTLGLLREIRSTTPTVPKRRPGEERERRKHEERTMRERFGSEYDDYARRTKRLIPGVW
jgi:hypothetical protein